MRPKTIFLDIDGTIIKHTGNLSSILTKKKSKLLPGTIEVLNEWDRKGYNIILTSGRRENMRASTEKELERVGIFYDQLIMGIGGGARVIINDRKDDSNDDTAISINLPRNNGIKGLKDI